MSNGSGQPPSARSQRVLRAILPLGILFLIAWVVWVVATDAIGAAQRGVSVVSTGFGLATSLLLIVSGWYYRRNIGPS